jgi:hypothetical protein
MKLYNNILKFVKIDFLKTYFNSCDRFLHSKIFVVHIHLLGTITISIYNFYQNFLILMLTKYVMQKTYANVLKQSDGNTMDLSV